MTKRWLTVVDRWFFIAPLILLLAAFPAHAWKLWEEGDKLHGQFGGYVHYGSSDDYQGPPIAGILEINKASDWLYGLSLFNNSFGQFSQYLYLGKKWRLPEIHEYLHVKLTGGVVHGYVDEFEDKLNFNHNGFAPAIVPSIGLKKDRFAFDFIILGDAGLMFAVGYDFIE